MKARPANAGYSGTPLSKKLVALRGKLRADAALWVSWPKQASRQPTDITEDVSRRVVLPLGFVDIKELR